MKNNLGLTTSLSSSLFFSKLELCILSKNVFIYFLCVLCVCVVRACVRACVRVRGGVCVCACMGACEESNRPVKRSILL